VKTVSGRIPEDIIESLRQQADIVEIIAGSVALKKQGQNYTGLCPFHQEKTPSFVVSPAKQIFHCFGCGKGGNVFTFLMEQEGLSFQEAAERLAARYGIALPDKESTPAQKRQEAAVKRYRQINEWAMELYQQALASKAGAIGREYFSQRGLTGETIRQFRLGYALDQWEFLTRELTAKGVSEQELLLLGLAVTSGRGSLVDKFRGRAIFPILDEREQVVGFGGRIIGEGQPKYLNSQETPVFHKGKELYGLFAAKNAIRQQDRAILMEGYMDVLAAHQQGITNAVASLGTSLTAEQAKLLTRYTYHTLVCYDSDSAGEAATLRALEVLDRQGLRAGVIRVSEGKDPDDFLKLRGRDAFIQLTEKAFSIFEYKFSLNMEKFDKEEMSGKVAVIQASLPDLARVQSPVARQGYITMMADTLHFPETAIRDELKRYFTGNQKKDQRAPVMALETAGRNAEELAQSVIIRGFLRDVSRREVIEDAGGEALFGNTAAKSLYQTLTALIMAGYVTLKEEELVALLDREEERQWLTGILLQEEHPGDESKVFQDSLLTLRRQRVERQIKEKMTKLTAAEKTGDNSAAREIMTALSGLNREKQKLKP
jgi:DNA primase